MQKTDNNPRRNFLKKIPVALVSISAFSLFKLKKSNYYSENKFKTLSNSDANEIIKNEMFSDAVNLKPEPAPKAQNNQKG
jgi:hypothetical protein